MCKYCEDLDWLYDIVCYVPTENGSSIDLPVNHCPVCGRNLTEEEDSELEKFLEACRAVYHRVQNALPDGCISGMLCPIKLEEENNEGTY